MVAQDNNDNMRKKISVEKNDTLTLTIILVEKNKLFPLPASHALVFSVAFLLIYFPISAVSTAHLT